MTTKQCQRCRLPLVIHDSLQDLGPAQLRMLSKHETSNLIGQETIPYKNDAIAGITKSSWNGQTSPTSSQSGNGGESYILLDPSMASSKLSNSGNGSDAANSVQSAISTRVRTLENVFENLSSKSEIDYPVCSDCAELVRDKLKEEYEALRKERDLYVGFLNQLKNLPQDGAEEIDQVSKEIESMEREKERAVADLKAAEAERVALENELEELKREEQRLESEEEAFYALQNEAQMKQMLQIEEKVAFEAVLENKGALLKRLQKVNVYNDAFCISHDGYFGTINGLRLGRLSSRKVEWSEINAAWGQTLLLIATVIQKLDIKIEGYRLRPLGSCSKIERVSDNKTINSLELYSAGDYAIERVFSHKRLDAAMVAFLAVIKQVCTFIESRDVAQKTPYAIDKDKIGGLSIKLTISAADDKWTTACKYVLTNSKWILAYASKQG